MTKCAGRFHDDCALLAIFKPDRDTHNTIQANVCANPRQSMVATKTTVARYRGIRVSHVVIIVVFIAALFGRARFLPKPRQVRGGVAPVQSCLDRLLGGQTPSWDWRDLSCRNKIQARSVDQVGLTLLCPIAAVR